MKNNPRSADQGIFLEAREKEKKKKSREPAGPSAHFTHQTTAIPAEQRPLHLLRCKVCRNWPNEGSRCF